MLTVENTSNRSISIFGDVSEQFIGENKLLVLNDQCAPSPPAPGGRLPTIVCTSAKSLPIEVEPHASAELRTIYVFKGLEGMPSLTSGKYTADASIVWKYADESENHTSTAQIVYSVK
jgi:hypothetical protein